MNLIKSFDFFQKEKETNDTLSHQTIIGAILSITSIVFMISLMISQLITFISPTFQHDALIIQANYSNDTDTNTNYNHIPMNISLFFNQLPCDIISVDMEDNFIKHVLNIQDTLHKTRVFSNGSFVPYTPHTSLIVTKFIESLKEGEGCKIEGYINLPKAPGNIHVSFHPYGYIWNSVRNDPDDVEKLLKMTHKVTMLHFGEYNQALLNEFNMDLASFDRIKDLPDFSKESSSSLNNYEYHLKIIPFELLNEKGKKEMTYQYSLLYNVFPFDINKDKMPYVMLRYDFGAITMRITKRYERLSRFLTRISAIIGGIFVVFTILNRILVFYNDLGQYTSLSQNDK